jgi:G6PDH family F420-dependent oxidoreductase
MGKESSMAEIGVFLASEEHGPSELVRIARRAEAAGFRSVLISDHFHPWLDIQGQSPFVWSVIGGIAATTELRVTTGVTCPTVRIHPAIVAHAAATSQLLLDGRFVLGVGSGENLNEHILGDRWPSAGERLEMLEEAVEVMRALWSGKLVTHRGGYYTVDNARLYSCPPAPPPVVVSAFGPKAASLAARIGDGFITVTPDADLVRTFRQEGGTGPVLGSVKLCWDTDEGRARKRAHALWPTDALPGQLNQELALPQHFEAATQLVPEEGVTSSVPCGPDPTRHADAIRKYVDAGFDEIYVNQIGPDQEGFLDFFANEVRPLLGG